MEKTLSNSEQQPHDELNSEEENIQQMVQIQELIEQHSGNNLDLNEYSNGDQTVFAKLDTRIQVTDHTQYPYNLMGKIWTEYEDLTKNSKPLSGFGTGIKIAPRVVLTSAHNFYSHGKSKKVIKATFLPFGCFKQNHPQGIKIQQFYIHPNYLIKESSFSLRHDIALVILQDSHYNKTRSQNEQYCKINYEYIFQKQPSKILMLVSYPEDKQNLKDFRHQQQQCNLLFREEKKPIGHNDGFVQYRFSTADGSSGGAVFYKNDHDSSYQIVAIHKSKDPRQTNNRGLLINDFSATKQILSQIIETYHTTAHPLKQMARSIYEPTYKRLKEIIVELRDDPKVEALVDQLRQARFQTQDKVQVIRKRQKELAVARRQLDKKTQALRTKQRQVLQQQKQISKLQYVLSENEQLLRCLTQNAEDSQVQFKSRQLFLEQILEQLLAMNPQKDKFPQSIQKISSKIKSQIKYSGQFQLNRQRSKQRQNHNQSVTESKQVIVQSSPTKITEPQQDLSQLSYRQIS